MLKSKKNQRIPKIDLVCETNKELCTRCGMCAGICPEECFIFDDDNYPRLISSKCTGCGLCTKICPGEGFDLEFFSQKLFGKSYRLKNILGLFNDAYVGYAADQNVRVSATAGGIVTAILICLLKQNRISGAIVTVFNRNHPEISEPILVRTKDELMKSLQSKYTIIPLNRVFRDLKKIDGKFALVGLPCHVQAFRKLAEVVPSFANKISLVIGLYCAGTAEQRATSSLINMLGVRLVDVKEIQYRGGCWPGEFKVFTKDGMCYSCAHDIFKYLFNLYCPKRCLTCFDYSNEFSDISVAEAWIWEKGGWKYPGGQSIILERTQVGQEVLQLAQSKGYINIHRIPKEEAIKTHKRTSNLRKKRAITRITRLKIRSKKCPDYGIIFPTVSREDYLEEMRYSLGMVVGKFFLSRKLIETLAFTLVNELPKVATKSKVRRIFWRGVNLLLSAFFRW